jgi:hypothetical protein
MTDCSIEQSSARRQGHTVTPKPTQSTAIAAGTLHHGCPALAWTGGSAYAHLQVRWLRGPPTAAVCTTNLIGLATAAIAGTGFAAVKLAKRIAGRAT